VLQQRELRWLGVRVRAVAALLRVFSLRVLALVIRFRLVFFNQESLLFGRCGPWAQGNYHHRYHQLAVAPVPGGRPAAVNWSRGTVRQATLGSPKCYKYRARWGVSAS